MIDDRQIDFNNSLNAVNSNEEMENFFVNLEIDRRKKLIKNETIKISSVQFEKILEKCYEDKSPYAIKAALSFGIDCVELSDDQVKRLMLHKYNVITELLVTKFTFKEPIVGWMIKSQREFERLEKINKGYFHGVGFYIIRKNAFDLSKSTIQDIQENGDILECSELWAKSVGSPPFDISKIDAMGIRKKMNNNAFREWQVE